eukprot:8849930-Pyramimonas_sp.AAC.1
MGAGEARVRKTIAPSTPTRTTSWKGRQYCWLRSRRKTFPPSAARGSSKRKAVAREGCAPTTTKNATFSPTVDTNIHA